jgi:hypothetical protein
VETTAPAPPPPPPPPPASDAAIVRRGPRPGQLTPLWRVATVAAWVLVFVAWSGVWKASRELGVATWWLGPDGDPMPIFVSLAPFVAPLAMVLLALNNVRRLPWCGLAAAAVSAAIGIVDLSYVRRLGIAELAIAAAGAAVAVAGFGSTYRRASVASPTDEPDEQGPHVAPDR